ncbi:phasin family protein [Noviherbaspirillum cavernae]|uniref:Phasin family protein n=1 Tax=Noviherbaspirillum cavernae TaxID=2320862 RepID=A0A418X5Y7_9BURK|nr:TIGR01841 family phasin [Noviherbaspirillum cavernae]RJG07849.1 phasin family protein [Noviherbaspirillum cavernae]
MFTIPEQFSAASKASVEAQLALISSLTNKAFESVGKIADLNIAVAKTALEESNVAAKQLFAAKDPQEWLSVSAAFAQPAAEKAQAYARHLAGIATDVQTELTKAAESQISESSRKVLELVEELTKNAPAGSENAIALLKSAIGNANAGYEQFTKNTKQAVESLEANLNNAVSQFAQPAATKAAGRASVKK